jgi:hypothetical protein
LEHFGTRTNHEQTQTHKTQHGQDLGEATTFPFIVPLYSILCAWPQDQHPNVILSRDSQVGVPKFPKLGFPRLWGPITLCENLRLRWGWKQSYSPSREFSNDMLQATWMQGNQENSWLLSPSPSFDHNLCFKCPNGSCEPILDIYVSIAFQKYKELFNPMGFNPCNRFLKIWKSIGTPTPKVGTHLGVWGFVPSHSLHSREHAMWIPGFPDRDLVKMMNPYVGCKDCSPILVNFCLSTKNFRQDWTSLSCHFDVSTSSVSSGVVDVVDCASTSLVIDYTPLTFVCVTSIDVSWSNSFRSWFFILLPKMLNSFH